MTTTDYVHTITSDPKIDPDTGDRITFTLRWDGEHNPRRYFSTTVDVHDRKGREVSGGVASMELLERFAPEWAHLAKWHLCSTDGPMYYLSTNRYAGNPLYHVQQGNLDYARACAVWPEATDEDLRAEGLDARLAERLPALLADFRADMEAIGFDWDAPARPRD